MRFLLVTVLAVLTLSLLAGCGRDAAEPTYFRVTAHLKHGDEPVDFNVVVECRWSVAGELGGAPSGRASRSPYLFGVKTKDNHAVLMQIPGCLLVESKVLARISHTTSGSLLADLFWSDTSDDFPMLVGYFSDDGYHHPLSQLTFVDASITLASKGDREEWEKTTGRENLVTRKNDPFQIWRTNSSPDHPTYIGHGYGCEGAVRYPVREANKEELRRYWPQNHPDYWAFRWDDQEQRAAEQRLGVSDEQVPPSFFVAPIGLPRASAQQGGANSTRKFTYESVPAVWNRGQPFLPPTPNIPGHYVYNIVANGWRDTGLAFCYDQLLSKGLPDGRLPFVIAIDGSVVPNSERPVLPHKIFYRDRYFIRTEEILFSDEWGMLP